MYFTYILDFPNDFGPYQDVYKFELGTTPVETAESTIALNISIESGARNDIVFPDDVRLLWGLSNLWSI